MEKTKAILIDLIHPRMLAEHAMERMEELEELVNTYGGFVIVKKHQKRFAPHPRTFIGPGKVEEIGRDGKALGAKLLIINDKLKPRQIYQLQEMLRPAKIDVWDRIDLILKIFARHARTTEARLEIELASIRHMGPRIYGMGMELSRQAGGIGTVGIGETNSEIMKRHLKERERKIRADLEKYESVRRVHRADRKRRGLPTAAIVGYTNAGKTTLLNALTGRREYAADVLFATLDTRVGKLYLPKTGKQILISDTIGFIKQLPPELLNAFASTLSEAVEADLLLHVVDVSDKNVSSHLQVVDEILGRLGALGKPKMLIMNKADRIDEKRRDALAQVLPEGVPVVWVSAVKGQGIAELIEKLESFGLSTE